MMTISSIASGSQAAGASASFIPSPEDNQKLNGRWKINLQRLRKESITFAGVLNSNQLYAA